MKKIISFRSEKGAEMDPFKFVNEKMFINAADPNVPRMMTISPDRQTNPFKDDVVLFIHGNEANNTGYRDRAKYIANKLGKTVYMVDYPGYGSVKPLDVPPEKVYSAILDWFMEILEGDGGISFYENKFIIYGFSLGGSFALDLAVRILQKNGWLAKLLKGVVVHNSFADFSTAMKAWGWPEYTQAVRLNNIEKLQYCSTFIKTVWIYTKGDILFPEAQHTEQLLPLKLSTFIGAVEGGNHLALAIPDNVVTFLA